MGTFFSKQSTNISQTSPINHSSSILDQNRSTSIEKPSYDFDTNQLNFIPDSEQQWNVRVPTPVFQQSTTIPKIFPRPTYSPPMPTQKYKCDQCGMVFPSNESLFKHKTRFCIGVKDSGIGRKAVYSDDEETEIHTKRSTARKVRRHQSPIEKKREEVHDWKRQRSILQTVEDMEDRLRTDTFRAEKLTNHHKQQDLIYNEILLEYERIQNQERNILLQMYNIQMDPLGSTKLNQTLDLTVNQRGQFEDLQRRNLRLEQERRIIQKKLEELISSNYQPTSVVNYEPYRFLREMKEQHELNEKALNFLRSRLIYHENSLSTVSEIPSLPYVNTRYTRLRRTGGDTSRSFRHSYLKSGGRDPSIIERYSDVENRLRAYEDYPWTKDYPEPLKPSRYQSEGSIDPQNERLKIANDENQRLQSELHEMHQKFETLNTRTRHLELSMTTNGQTNSTHHQRHGSARTDPYPQSQRSVRDYDQSDQRQNHQQASLPVLDKRITPRASPAMSLLVSNMNRLHDPLVPQSYDPIGGFIIFFDFIVSLPPSIEQCCLIACLHHPKSGLGGPSQIEPFKCEQYLDDKSGERMCAGLIATKQPVPRCPPQQALTVVIEVQTATSKQLAEDDFKTTSWTKLPLFDNKNRLLSGRWKVPLKAIPIHHDESLAIISTLPRFEHAELHYRLVNFQDGDDQSHAPLSPSFRDLYVYPLQYRT